MFKFVDGDNGATSNICNMTANKNVANAQVLRIITTHNFQR